MRVAVIRAFAAYERGLSAVAAATQGHDRARALRAAATTGRRSSARECATRLRWDTWCTRARTPHAAIRARALDALDAAIPLLDAGGPGLSGGLRSPPARSARGWRRGPRSGRREPRVLRGAGRDERRALPGHERARLRRLAKARLMTPRPSALQRHVGFFDSRGDRADHDGPDAGGNAPARRSLDLASPSSAAHQRLPRLPDAAARVRSSSTSPASPRASIRSTAASSTRPEARPGRVRGALREGRRDHHRGRDARRHRRARQSPPSHGKARRHPRTWFSGKEVGLFFCVASDATKIVDGRAVPAVTRATLHAFYDGPLLPPLAAGACLSKLAACGGARAGRHERRAPL